MSLIKWTPFLDPFEEMDRALRSSSPAAQSGFMPAIDMYQTKDAVVVEALLPKFSPEDVSVSVEGDSLVIQGKMTKQSEVEEKNYYRKEMHAGSFCRTVALPGHVIADKAQASFSEGVLKVEVPKLQEKPKKSVKVEVKKETKKKK